MPILIKNVNYIFREGKKQCKSSFFSSRHESHNSINFSNKYKRSLNKTKIKLGKN